MRGVKPLTLLEVCEDLEDPRTDRVTKFELNELFFAAAVAMLCGATSYKTMAIIANDKLEWLRRYLPYDNGTPSANTFRNILSRMNPDHVHAAFAKWAVSTVEKLHTEGVVAIDGKTVRGTRGKDRKPAHVVSAFSSAVNLVLGQVACDTKSNEITAIPELLEMLDIHGCLITIDAMGSQRAIAEQIIEEGGDYLLQIKGNQKTLHTALEDSFETVLEELQSVEADGYDYARTEETGHGRHETRECILLSGTDWMGGTQDKWPTVHFGAVIRSTVCRDSESETVSLHYFIGSREGMTAADCLAAKRQHWSIENKLHWVLDVQFAEDSSKAHSDHSAENLNALRHIAYNALRLTPEVKGSFRERQLSCLLNDEVLSKVAQHLVAAA